VTVTVVNGDGQSDATVFTFVEGVAPAVFAVSPTVLHAEVGGDELVVFGERLDRLGLPLVAEAVVTGDDDATTTTTLRVIAVADALVRATVEDPLLAGVVRVTLRGTAGAVVGPPVTARSPEVTQLQLDLGKPSPDALLFGENLAGDRLVGIAIGATPCSSVIADERLAVCALSTAGAAAIASSTDRTLTLDYAEGSRVRRVAASELVRGTAPAPSCGNGALEGGEACDDGNSTDDDGCSSACRIEVPPP
jgi:cysteine-rich repeat protein